MALAAEDTGFNSLWVGDHLLYRGDGRGEQGAWDASRRSGWLSGSAPRRARPLVACTAFHPPGVLARMFAALDELTAVVLSPRPLGAGWNTAEFRAFGLPFDYHVSRFEEAFTIIRLLLDGERVTFTAAFTPSMTPCSCRHRRTGRA